MKRNILITLIACLWTTLAFSQGTPAPGTMQFYTQDGTPFLLWVNGIQQNTQAVSSFTLNGLTANGYMVKIEFTEENAGPPMERHMALDLYTDYVYVLRKKQNSDVDKSIAGFRNEVKSIFGEKVTKEEEEQTSRNVVWEMDLVSATSRAPADMPSTSGTLKTAPDPQPETGSTGSTTSVNSNVTTSDTYSGTTTTTTSSTGGTGNGESANLSVSMTINDGTGGTQEDIHMSGSSTYEEHTTVTTTTTTTTSGGGEMIMEEPSGCFPMNDYDFQDAKSSISSKSFSDSKMKIAQQVSRNNCLTSLQIKQVVELFDFESDRLEFAKYAYDYSYDPQNYYKVNDAFEFESTIEELDAYISNR